MSIFNFSSGPPSAISRFARFRKLGLDGSTLLGSIASLSWVLLVPGAASSNQLQWKPQSSPQRRSPDWVQNQIPSSGLLWKQLNLADQVPRAIPWRTVSLTNQLALQPSVVPSTSSDNALDPTSSPQISRTLPVVMALSRSITVDRIFYPDVALTVPNGFQRDPQRFFSLALTGTNQVRRGNFQSCRDGSSSCPDVELDAELALLHVGSASLELLYNVANVVSDSNNQGWKSQGLGFRAAYNLTSNFGIAIGGESQLDIDNGYCPVDADCGQLKGRTLFAVASVAIPLSKTAKPPVLTVSAGVGNGYYGFNGKGASDSQWGPFGSVSYAFNESIAIGVEYSGYALSAGVSVKPFKAMPLIGSLYVTDFFGNFPSYLDYYCYNGDCSPRLLGRLTYSF